ncbi:efflux RND transporter periplasmic adaptor subunit [Bosea sp. F3-2]|uniref:efflux RND transporter periplasmic adaptor subunit n=1 Tax=Bosea sp. F3-2 TaxID=2599640 RepID=UPI0011EE65EC|nr:efflux RND transporter periplasmic adaptor subunit [Bosea sp. F3-2]QEL26217.1 efflux RND transporter periplasmic adaptor subunit [Bosea sp. F3-2]
MIRSISVLFAAILSYIGPFLFEGQKAFSQDDYSACLLRPKRTIQLGSSVFGVIDEMFVDRGSWVQRGQVVAKLNTTVEEAQVELDRHRAQNPMAIESARTNMSWNERELSRKKKLRDNMFSKINDVDELETKIAQDLLSIRRGEFDQKSAQLELARSEAQLQLKMIKSPIDGVVTDIKLNLGEYIRDTTPMMSIAEVNILHADIFVPAEYYSQLKVGMTMALTLDAPLNRTVAALIDVIDPVVDAASDTFRIRLVVDNAANRLLAGVRCNVKLPSRERN